jgi:hypothetical protein
MNMLLPFAEKMLREHGEFSPYGGAMLADGSLTMLAASDGREYPASRDLIALMESDFRAHAHRGTYEATAMVYDVRTVPPGATEKTDAMAVRLDHARGYSVVVMIPYRLVQGEGEVFATKGAGSIFPAPH